MASLVIGVHSLFSDNMNCVKNWGLYLFAPEFDKEKELRNKIGAIWIRSLLDSVEGEVRTIAKYREDADQYGAPHVVRSCEQAALFVECVKEVLRLYSKDEQLFISDIRDQIVHSWLGRRHSAVYNVKHFNGTTIISEQMTRSDHHKTILSVCDSKDVDPTLVHLMERFRDPWLRYWHVLAELQASTFLERFVAEMLGGRTIELHSLTEPIRAPVTWKME